MKQIRIRIYRIQDFDLYTLYYDPTFDLQGAFRQVISAYVRGEPRPVIEVSDIKPLPAKNKACAVMSFTLEDEDEIRLLEDASRTWRNMNNFCKSLLRRSLAGLDVIYGLQEYPDPMHSEVNMYLPKRRRRLQGQGVKKEKAAAQAKEKQAAKAEEERRADYSETLQKTSEAVKIEQPAVRAKSPGLFVPEGKIDPFAMIAKWSEE